MPTPVNQGESLAPLPLCGLWCAPALMNTSPANAAPSSARFPRFDHTVGIQGSLGLGIDGGPLRAVHAPPGLGVGQRAAWMPRMGKPAAVTLMPVLEPLRAAGERPTQVMAQADWDLMFQAVATRLRLTLGAATAAHSAGRISTIALECVQALEQLHAELTQERSQRRHIETELCQAMFALAHARQELNGTQADARRARHLALHDSLTALPNRRGFNERLDQALAPPGAALAVFYLDLDGFKLINDSHGHGVGDELLRIVATRLAHAMRAEDMVCRMGGDEFACLLVDPMDREQLSGLACKLFDTVSAPVQVGTLSLSVRPSIGIAMSPTDGLAGDVLLRSADAAMYHAKRQRMGYAFYNRPADA
jgi:diguanylate cyclase